MFMDFFFFQFVRNDISSPDAGFARRPVVRDPAIVCLGIVWVEDEGPLLGSIGTINPK